MPKHIDSIPKLADFRGPWTTEDGTEVDIDREKARKYVHDLLTDKAKAQDERDAAKEQVAALTTERDELKEQVEKADGADATSKIAKAEKTRDEAIRRAEEAEARANRAEVIAEKGLDEKQAKYLPASGTKDELLAKADELIEDFGGSQANPDDDDDEDEDEVRTSPRVPRRLVTGGDSNNGADQDPDFEKIAAQIAGSRVL